MNWRLRLLASYGGAMLPWLLVSCGNGAAHVNDCAPATATNNSAGTGADAPSGSSGKGGSGPNVAVNAPTGAWTDVSPPDSKGDCSAVVVNRLTGEVLTDVTQQGVWKSVNQGADWARVDGNTVSGLVVLGPGFDVDQNAPEHVAAWSLDGDAAFTNDGKSWTKMANLGRNWDFGSTDWSSPEPRTRLVTRHESGGEVYLSRDGATSWELTQIRVMASGAGYPPPAFAMVGVLGPSTLIYSDGAGLLRSIDGGKTFTKVSDLNARTRVPVAFKSAFYLGGDGLIVSRDQGATWQKQGSELEIWVGPYFGADEDHFMVANKTGVYLTADAGVTFTQVAPLPADPKYDPQIFGGFAWDPQGHFVYAAALGKPLLRLKLEP